MFKAGGRVLHDEYGLGVFKAIFGDKTRVAVVEFNRGRRFFVLPAERLLCMSTNGNGVDFCPASRDGLKNGKD